LYFCPFSLGHCCVLLMVPSGSRICRVSCFLNVNDIFNRFCLNILVHVVGAFMTYYRVCNNSNTTVSLIEQELLTLPEYPFDIFRLFFVPATNQPYSPCFYNGIRISLFMLSYTHFCILVVQDIVDLFLVMNMNEISIWVPLYCLVLLRFMASDCHFSIFKLGFGGPSWS
jgi:hypothetical protein